MRAQKKRPKSQQVPYAGATTFAPNAGYIIFKDKKPVVFYTNDLAFTPSARVLDGKCEEAINCCHGLSPMRRWTGNESMYRKAFMVPTVIAVYNLTMNGVDRVDQLRATNPTRRKEQRLPMSLFTWLLDLSAINAFALLKKLQGAAGVHMTLRELKRRIVVELTESLRQSRRRQEHHDAKKQKRERLEDIMGIDHNSHVLTPNANGGRLYCKLCRIRGIKNRSRYTCTSCLEGYHVEYFAAVHYRNGLSSESDDVRAALEAICRLTAGTSTVSTRRHLNTSVTQLDQLQLPPK